MSIDITPVCLSEDRHPSFVGGYMLSDPTVCDGLIQFMDSSLGVIDGTTHQGMILGKNGDPIVDTLSKDCMQRDVNWNDHRCTSYGAELQKCLDAYLEEFEFAEKVPAFSNGVQNPTLQKYSKGGAYHKWHAERGVHGSWHRHLVFMTYLNDVSDAGETEFLYQKMKVRPRKGLTLIWPTDWTHTHRGIPSPTQEKYIVTGWYCFTGE